MQVKAVGTRYKHAQMAYSICMYSDVLSGAFWHKLLFIVT